MITGYSRPQLKIKQLLQRQDDPTVRSLNAFVFGPKYDLFRYTNAAERKEMAGVKFTDVNDDQLVPYEGLTATHIVDPGFVKVYAEKLEGELANLLTVEPTPLVGTDEEKAIIEAANAVNPYSIKMLALATPNKLRVSRHTASVIAKISDVSYGGYYRLNAVTISYGGSGYTPDSTFDIAVPNAGIAAGGVIRLTVNSVGVIVSGVIISPGSGYTADVPFSIPVSSSGANVGDSTAALIDEVYGRPVKAGDIVYAKNTTTGVITRRTVKSVEKENTLATFGSNVSKTNKRFLGGSLNPIPSDTASFTAGNAPTSWTTLLSTTSILGVTVDNAGSGYALEAPTLEIAKASRIYGDLVWPVADIASASPVVTVAGTVSGVSVVGGGGTYLSGGVVKLNITNPGIGYTTKPTITIGNPPDLLVNRRAVVEAVITGGTVSGYKILDPGCGYAAVPAVSFSGGSPVTEAQATAIINNGVTSIPVTASSSFTANNLPVISISAPANGETATAEARLVGTGIVIAITCSGSGYTSVPTITIGGHAMVVATPYSPSYSVTIGTPTLATRPAITVVGGSGSGLTVTPVIISKPADWVGLIEGANYDRQYGERYTLTVTKGGTDGARVRIRSSSGGFSADNVAAEHLGFGYTVQSAAFGGLAVELRHTTATQPLRIGDQFSFIIRGEYAALDLGKGGELINDVTILSPGTGYTVLGGVAQPLIISAPPTGGIQAAGTIKFVALAAVFAGGSGYTRGDVLQVQGGNNGATKALLTVIDVDGVSTGPITRIDVGFPGIYTADPSDPASVTGGTGTSATFNFSAIKLGARTNNAGSAGVVSITIQGSGYLAAPWIRYTDGTGTGLILEGAIATPETERHLSPVQSGVYTGPYDTRYQITVTKGTHVPSKINPFNGAKVRITDTAGIDSLQEYTIVQGTQYNLGTYGLKFVFPELAEGDFTRQAGLRKGDVYFIDAVAAKATGAASIIVLNGQATDVASWNTSNVETTTFDIQIMSTFTGLITPQRDNPEQLAYELAATGVNLHESLKIFIADRDEDFQWVPVKASPNGRLFAHWRGLVPANSGDSIKLYSSEASIIAKYGKFDIDNLVCYAAILAFRGAQEKPIYVMHLETNDEDGYTKILRQAERVDGIYSMVPVTSDFAIQELVKTHVLKVSTETWKLWRRAYFATQNPGKFVVMSVDADAEDFVATVANTSSGNVRVLCDAGDFQIRGIRPTDLFRTNYRASQVVGSTEEEYDEYVVQTVLEDQELLLVSGPVSPISEATRFEIWRPDTGRSQAEFIAERSDAFENRRIVNVWCDGAFMRDENSNVVYVPVYYLAAEIAGLRSAALPQQGLTYTEIDHAIDAAPLMFSKYTDEELNIAAASGTMIVAQDVENGPIFIRHQLTTDSSNGSLYYEDSVGMNLDNISYALKDLLQPYIGKRNATNATVEEILTRSRATLEDFKTSTSAESQIGPALIDYKKLTVALDTVFKDRINMDVALELPLPLNSIIVTLRATTIQNEEVLTQTSVTVG